MGGSVFPKAKCIGCPEREFRTIHSFLSFPRHQFIDQFIAYKELSARGHLFFIAAIFSFTEEEPVGKAIGNL
jgi:hypothetical protein